MNANENRPAGELQESRRRRIHEAGERLGDEPLLEVARVEEPGERSRDGGLVLLVADAGLQAARARRGRPRGARSRPAPDRRRCAAAVTSPSTVTSDATVELERSGLLGKGGDVALHLGAGGARGRRSRGRGLAVLRPRGRTELDQRSPVVGQGIGLRGRGEADRGERVACGAVVLACRAARATARFSAACRASASRVRAVCSFARAAVTVAASSSKRASRGPRGLGVGRVGQAVADFGELVLEPGATRPRPSARPPCIRRPRRGRPWRRPRRRPRPPAPRRSAPPPLPARRRDTARPATRWARTVQAAFAVRSDSMCASAAVAASTAAARDSASSFAASRAAASSRSSRDARSWSARTRVIASLGPDAANAASAAVNAVTAAATAADSGPYLGVDGRQTVRDLGHTLRHREGARARRPARSQRPRHGRRRTRARWPRRGSTAPSPTGRRRPPARPPSTRPRRGPPEWRPASCTEPGAVVRHRRLAGGGERPRPLHHALVHVEPQQLLQQVLPGGRLVVQEAGELALREHDGPRELLEVETEQRHDGGLHLARRPRQDVAVDRLETRVARRRPALRVARGSRVPRRSAHHRLRTRARPSPRWRARGPRRATARRSS